MSIGKIEVAEAATVEAMQADLDAKDREIAERENALDQARHCINEFANRYQDLMMQVQSLDVLIGDAQRQLASIQGK